MNNARGKATKVPTLLICTVLAVSVLLSSCSGKKEKTTNVKKGDKVYGFILGEKKSELFKRAGDRITFKKVKRGKRTDDPRDDVWTASGALEYPMGVDHVRLTFLDDHLMEVIVYFKDTSVSRMRALRRMLQNIYGSKGVSPDGTVETVYKTYRFETPDMSITLRRITKIGSTELYIQFLHKELHRLFIKRTGRA